MRDHEIVGAVEDVLERLKAAVKMAEVFEMEATALADLMTQRGCLTADERAARFKAVQKSLGLVDVAVSHGYYTLQRAVMDIRKPGADPFDALRAAGALFTKADAAKAIEIGSVTLDGVVVTDAETVLPAGDHEIRVGDQSLTVSVATARETM